MILVIGATGNVGRHVVSGLLPRDVEVRALARDPDAAELPPGVEVVPGDVSDATSVGRHLEGIDAVFLVWPFFAAQGASELVETLATRTGRIGYLSAEAVRHRPDSAWAAVEGSIADSGVEWTFLRPTGFAANTLMWAPQIRRSGVVRWPYGRAARSLIHERDIAEVAVLSLTEGGHGGARHVLSGPESLIQAEQDSNHVSPRLWSWRSSQAWEANCSASAGTWPCKNTYPRTCSRVPPPKTRSAHSSRHRWAPSSPDPWPWGSGAAPPWSARASLTSRSAPSCSRHVRYAV